MQQQLNLVNGISKRELFEITTTRGEGAFALDQSGKLLFLNQEAEELIGWQADELLGKNFFQTVNFKLDAIATIGTSECAALSSVGCSHLHKGANVTCKDGKVMSIVFISMPVFDGGKLYGKAYVFSELRDARVEAEMYRAMIESAGSILVKIDVGGNIVYANQYCKDMFGNNIEPMLPTSTMVKIRENPQSIDSHLRLKKRCRNKDGRIIMIAWAVNPILGINGKVIGAMCVGNDITEKQPRASSRSRANENVSQALMPDKALTQKVLDHISDAVITIDKDGFVEYLNPVAEQLTGWVCAVAKGELLKDVYHVVDDKTRKQKTDSVLYRSHDTREENNKPTTSLLLRRDGWEFNIEESTTAIRDQQGNIVGAVLVFRDISHVQDINHLMASETHDPLTGVFNRKEFEARLTQAITSARTEGRLHALCYLDLDQFKLLNERYGRDAGDELLKQVASLLYSRVRDTDILARIGSDEFAVLLRNCSLENAQETAQAFCEEIKNYRFDWKGEILQLGVSVGLVPITSNCGGLADILRIADAACYVAKDKGKSRVHVYHTHDMALQQSHAELQWVQRIRSSLDENRFKLYCQSIVPLNVPDNHVVHHEILLRMVDENNAILRPGAFISAAERYNLMPSIDRWVIQNALDILKQRMSRSKQIGIFAINLSAQSLDDENFLNFVIDQLDKTEVPASNICFEITESTAISNLISATRFMSILRGMGCRFALDDFGKGFSSYAYLKNLHVDYLKIDGSFVKDLAHDPIDHAMVDSINQIGHIMGVETIAEFVESEEALEKLIALGVDHVQGYQLGKPRPMWHSIHSNSVDEAPV